MILSISADDLSSFEVYGSTDTDKVAGYNDGFQGNLTNFVISKMPTIFPSEIEIEHGHVLTVGGLILLKLKRHSQQPLFKG